MNAINNTDRTRYSNSRNGSRYRSCSLASFFIVCSVVLWILGNSQLVLAQQIPQGLTGQDAVNNIRNILGDPIQFVQNLKDDTQDFVQDHFGTMAIAAAFSIALRAIVK